MIKKIEILKWTGKEYASEDPAQVGILHGFSTASENDIGGIDIYPVAIVQMPDGTFETPAVQSIRMIPLETFEVDPGVTTRIDAEDLVEMCPNCLKFRMSKDKTPAPGDQQCFCSMELTKMVCPECGGKVKWTERRFDGDSRCVNNHIHKTSKFISSTDE